MKKNKFIYLPTGILTITTALSGVALTSAGVAAETSGSKSAAVTVATSCNFTGTSGYTANLAVSGGNVTESDSSRTPYQVNCNNPSGFKIQAVGFSPDSTHPDGLTGNTAMYGTSGTIATGTTGPNSYWSFRIGFAYAIGGSSAIENPYDNYAAIPGTATDVVGYSSSTSSAISGFFRPDYQVYAAPLQPSGSYSGKVKFTLVPNA